MSETLAKVIDLVQVMTNDRMSLDGLYGPHHARDRQMVMAVIRGEPVTQQESGMMRLRNELYALAGIPADMCIAARDHAWIDLCREKLEVEAGLLGA